VAAGSRLNLPNIITLARIAVCPVLFYLAVSHDNTARYAAFVLFIVAALSDVWDGYLARKHGLITDLGKLLDPAADKLLLVVTLVPFYIVSHRPGELNAIPHVGALPLWVLIVLFGRELLITIFRQWAQGRGVVIAAGVSGKVKTLAQNVFIGALLLWFPMVVTAAERGWGPDGIWGRWSLTQTILIPVSLLVALVLTVYSMIDYLWSYRSVVGVRD
jgi:CDP-diacylglycerol---glycerol-3-phosphate 3-phosphatidyltransferase